jgi:hypothetical protein
LIGIKFQKIPRIFPIKQGNQTETGAQQTPTTANHKKATSESSSVVIAETDLAKKRYLAY